MNREIILRLFFILASAGLTFSSGAQCMTGAGVSGTSQICLGSTYSYNADYTSYCTWGCTSTVSYSFIVTGGTVTQSGYGFVRVKWTSVTGQIDLTVTDNVCWPDVLDQYGNPVCSNDCYTGSPRCICRRGRRRLQARTTPPVTMRAS